MQLHERLLSLPVGRSQMNAGFQVADAHGVALCFLSSPSVSQGQASRSVCSRERRVSTVSLCTRLEKEKRQTVCFG